jgi:hypothetical protein
MTRVARLWRAAAPRDRRAVLLGGALLLAAWLALRGVPWTLSRLTLLRARAAVATQTLANARATLAQEPQFRDSLGARAQRLVRWAPRLFAGGTPSEARADVGAWLTAEATRRRVRLTRLDIGGDSAVSVFTRLTVRVEVEGDVRGLTGWLAALDGGGKLVRVTGLRLSAPDAATPDTRSERLRAEITLVAWAATTRPDAGS